MASRKKGLILIFFIVFLDLLGFGIIIPLHSYLARQFNATPFEVGLLMAVYSFMQFLIAPFWGQLSDRIGRRPILLLSLLGASFSHLWFAFADSLTGLFLARALAGVFAANISTAMAYVADISTPEKRTQSMGIVGAAIGLGFVMGPFVGGVFGKMGMTFGTEPPFGQSFGAVIASAVCFLNFIWAFVSLKESLSKEVRESAPKQRGLLVKIQQIFTFLFDSKVGFVLLMYLLSMIAMGHMEVAMFLFVDDKFNWTFDEASLGFAYMGLVMAFTQGFLVRRFAPIIKERRMIFIGGILYLASLLGIALSADIVHLGVSVTLLGIGIGLNNPALTGSISLMASSSEQGKMMGVSQSLASLGRIIGPAVGSWLYYKYHPETPFYVAATLVSLVVLILIIKWKAMPEKA